MRMWISCVAMLGLWCGLAHAATQGPYRLLPQTKSAVFIGCWKRVAPMADEIVGYSSLGLIFLTDSKTREYFVLFPFEGIAKAYGVYASISDFQRAVLEEPHFATEALQRAHVARVRRRLGRLGEDEIYIPAPYPLLGGTAEVDTYDKGNIWVFVDIVAEMLGICERQDEPNKSLERTRQG
jgi:hypothetical protein